jgi:hypothetical protein
MAHLLTVHLRCNDAATGEATPVRVRVSQAGGTTFAPLGRSVEFPVGRNEAVGGDLKLGGERWFYIDGACEITLPTGVPVRIQIAKGPEYRAIDETVTLGPGQMALRYKIGRATDWRARGYHPGDTRCHFLPPHAGLLEAQAEDLDVANALAVPFPMLARDGNTYTVTPDLLAFSGQQPALEAPPHTFVVNTFNTHPVLGKVGLLHSHRAVYPLAFGGPDDTDDWSLCDWCDQCHRKGGLTVWVDAFESAGPCTGGEALVAALLGKVDAVEFAPGRRSTALLPWLYRLWDAGIRLPVVGAGGKDSNRSLLGAFRTFAHVPPPFSYRLWVEAVRAGRTFATSGPLIDFQVDGRRPGEAVVGQGAVAEVAVTEGLVPFDRFEVVADGEAVASVPPVRSETSGVWTARLEVAVPAHGRRWLAARCVGPSAFAHTSPVALAPPSPARPEAASALATLVRQTREWAETLGRYTNAKRREQLLARCDEAIHKLRSPDTGPAS